MDEEAVIEQLNAIVELELAGAIRYTQYTLMICGHARIPIIGWMKEQASEALDHARAAGEEVTTLGGRPSLGIGAVVATHHEGIDPILAELIEHERRGIGLYEELLTLVRSQSIQLEEYTRSMIRAEQLHLSEIVKMQRSH